MGLYGPVMGLYGPVMGLYVLVWGGCAVCAGWGLYGLVWGLYGLVWGGLQGGAVWSGLGAGGGLQGPTINPVRVKFKNASDVSKQRCGCCSKNGRLLGELGPVRATGQIGEL